MLCILLNHNFSLNSVFPIWLNIYQYVCVWMFLIEQCFFIGSNLTEYLPVCVCVCVCVDERGVSRPPPSPPPLWSTPPSKSISKDLLSGTICLLWWLCKYFSVQPKCNYVDKVTLKEAEQLGYIHVHTNTIHPLQCRQELKRGSAVTCFPSLCTGSVCLHYGWLG